MRKTKKLAALVLAAVMSVATLPMSVSAAWVTTDKGVVWENADGTQAKSKWMTMKSGKKYYIKSDGTRAVGLLMMKNKNGGKDYYYFDDSGVMQTGWQSVKGTVYYFGKDGKAAVKATVIGSYTYKFSTDGKWDGKVYSKDGKNDVTASVEVTKLVPVAPADRSSEYGKVKKIEGEKPVTVSIKGLTYRTDAVNQYGKVYAFSDGNVYTKAWINMADCTDEDLECLKYMTDLESLILVTKTKDEMLEKGKEDDLNGWAAGGGFQHPSKITNLDFIYYMPKLKKVSIYNAPYLTDVSGLSVCKNLQYVNFVNCGIKNLNGLENLTKIKEFWAEWTRLENLDGLKNCTKLEEIYVDYAYLNDISGIANKSNLKVVNILVNRRLKDITPLGTCKNITTVNLDGCNNIMDFSILQELPNLNFIALHLVSKKSNAVQVRDTLKASGIGNGIYDALIIEDTVKLHDSYTINTDMYWDYEMFSSDIYASNYPCNCSYCTNWRKTEANWTAVKGANEAVVALGTYQK